MPAHAPGQALLGAGEGREAVTALGVTGHHTLSAGTREFVADATREVLREIESPLSGITALAAGADQLVASELARAGAQLHVIVPCAGYERTFVSEGDLAGFRALLEVAHGVTRLGYPQPSEESFLAAGKRVVDLCERLIAVWDGEPARGLGGTADIVGYAREVGTPVSILWPSGIGR